MNKTQEEIIRIIENGIKKFKKMLFGFIICIMMLQIIFASILEGSETLISKNYLIFIILINIASVVIFLRISLGFRWFKNEVKCFVFQAITSDKNGGKCNENKKKMEKRSKST